jgi:hypothetical protein
MYEQSLVKIIEPIKKTTISRLNKSKKWKYGYNKEHDVIIISKTGQIGEVIEIQNLRIALPRVPRTVFKHEKNKWIKQEYPKELSKIKNIFDWRGYPDENKEQWYDYIDEEFKRRDEGFWFINNSSLYFGRHARQISGVMECAT